MDGVEETNLIVGGSGFIGGHLCEYFLAEGEISKGIFRRGSFLRIMDQCGVQCIEANLMDRHTLHEALDGVDVVYNLASLPPGRREQEYAEFNDLALRSMLEEAREHGVRTFVHLSCLDVYGFGRKSAVERDDEASPGDAYQRAKLGAEKIVRDFGQANQEMRIRVVRAARAIGPRDTTLTVPLLRMIEDGKVLLPSGSGASISFSHPKDVAQALLRAASANAGTEAHLVKSFDASLDEVASALLAQTGRQAAVKQQGLFSGKTALPAYAVEQVRAGIRLAESVQQSWKELNFTPAYGLERVARETAEWYLKEPWATKNLA